MFANSLKKVVLGLMLIVGPLLSVLYTGNAYGGDGWPDAAAPGSTDPASPGTQYIGCANWEYKGNTYYGVYGITHTQLANGNTASNAWPVIEYNIFGPQDRSMARLLPGPRGNPLFPELQIGGWHVMGAHGAYSEKFYDEAFGLVKDLPSNAGGQRILAFSCNAGDGKMSPLELVARKNPGRFVYGLSPNAINHTLAGPYFSEFFQDMELDVAVKFGSGGCDENPIAVGRYCEGSKKFVYKDLPWAQCQDGVSKNCDGVKLKKKIFVPSAPWRSGVEVPSGVKVPCGVPGSYVRAPRAHLVPAGKFLGPAGLVLDLGSVYADFTVRQADYKYNGVDTLIGPTPDAFIESVLNQVTFGGLPDPRNMQVDTKYVPGKRFTYNKCGRWAPVTPGEIYEGTIGPTIGYWTTGW